MKESKIKEEMKKKSITAFFSCSFHEKDAEIVHYFRTIALQCGVVPVLADEPGVGQVSEKVQARIREQDAFVAILTERTLEGRSVSAWISNEIGMANAFDKPIIVFREDTIDDFGMIPIITEYTSFSRDDLQSVLPKAYTFFNNLHDAIVMKSVSSQTKRSEIEYVKTYADLHDTRLYTNLPAKNKIADLVYNEFIASLNTPVLLDSGTVTYCIAERIVTSREMIPIVTNNLAIASDMDSVFHHSIYLLPGEVDCSVKATTGSAVAEHARIWLNEKVPKASLAIMGLRAFDPLKGFAEDLVSLNEFQATLLREAEKLVIVAQGEKFIKSVQHPIMPYSEFISILEKRRKEHSIWLVCHEPTLDISEATKIRYETIFGKLIELIGMEHVKIIES